MDRNIINKEQHTEYREWQEKKIKSIKNKYDSNPNVPKEIGFWGFYLYQRYRPSSQGK